MIRAAGPTVTQAANFSVLADPATIGISSAHPTGGSKGIEPGRFVPRAIIAHNIVEVLVVSVVNRPRLSSLCQMSVVGMRFSSTWHAPFGQSLSDQRVAAVVSYNRSVRKPGCARLTDTGIQASLRQQLTASSQRQPSNP
jgi:hypothetical protein